MILKKTLFYFLIFLTSTIFANQQINIVQYQANQVSKNKSKGRNKEFYPRSQKTILKTIQSIKDRETPEGFKDEDRDSINSLNIYRYLCGVENYYTTLDKKYTKQAQKAAEKCKSHGSLSHTIGDYTDKSNLSQGLSEKAAQVKMYINDPGDNNQKERGHRRNCLAPNVDITGFGQSGIFGAMRCFGSGKGNSYKQLMPYSYPGRGFFPKEYLHGNGWSYYVINGKIAQDVKVEMWQINRAPNRPVEMEEKVKGRKINIKNVFCNNENVVWEPEINNQQPAIYWVRIISSGYSDQYVVEIF